METGYELSQLHSQMVGMPIKNAVVLMDACFSGAKREGDQTAMQYMEKDHGLFTYYLLKKLKDSLGQVSLEALFEYVSENVNTTAIDISRKPQQPSVFLSPDMQEVWKDIKHKN